MDAKQFDELVARFTSDPSRRDALKGLVGGALAAVGLSAEALAKGKKGKRRKGAGGENKGGKGKQGGGKGKKSKGRGGASSEAIPNSGRCRCPGENPTGKTKRQRRRPRPCGKCESEHFDTKDNGKCVCTCKPEGDQCSADKPWQCCSNLCQNGLCSDYGG